MIGDQVTRFEAHLLEKERVAGGRAGPAAAAHQRHDLLGAAVNRVNQLHAADDVIVIRLGFDEYFLDARHLFVAARTRYAHRRCFILEHIDRIVERGSDPPGVRRTQLDAIGSRFFHYQIALKRGRIARRDQDCVPTIDDDPTFGARHRRRGREANRRTTQRCDVATTLYLLRRTAGIAGEAVLEVDAIHVRQRDDIDAEHSRADAVCLDVIRRRLGEIEQPYAESRRVGAGIHGNPFPFALEATPHRQRHITRCKASQLRGDLLIASLGDAGIPWLHRNGERGRRFSAAPRGEQHDGTTPQPFRPGTQQYRAYQNGDAERGDGALDRNTLDTASVIHRTSPCQCRLLQLSS